MGLLDDAIREHLDLKLRNGADPELIAQEEHEALDPVIVGPADAVADADAPGDPMDLYEDAAVGGPPSQDTAEIDMSGVLEEHAVTELDDGQLEWEPLPDEPHASGEEPA